MYSRLLNYPKEQSFFLFGPRGTGKTSWIKENFPQALTIDLLSTDDYTQYLARPSLLPERIPKSYNGWVVIDEIQRVPELLNEVHKLIEERKLKFILTGSSSRKLKRTGTNLLAGRAITCFMHPLTAAELNEDFALEKALKSGCLPMAYTQPNSELYLKSYVGTYLREEVLQEGLTRNLSAFSRFLEAASFSQAQPLNMAAVARDCQLSSKLIADYFTILEDLLLAVRVPIFSKRAKRKLIAHNKFFYFDCGVFSAIKPRGPLDSVEELQGAALETLFLQQLRAINDYFSLGYTIFYWHTYNDQEVDFVIYGEKGLFAFEIKRAARVSAEDLKSLKLFLSDYPEAKVYLLYSGSSEYHEAGVEILNIENAISKLVSLIS